MISETTGILATARADELGAVAGISIASANGPHPHVLILTKCRRQFDNCTGDEAPAFRDLSPAAWVGVP